MTDTNLTEEKKRLLELLKLLDPTKEEYATVLQNYKDLHDVDKTSLSLNNSTITSGAFNLLGLLMVLNFERVGIVTSNAMRFVKR